MTGGFGIRAAGLLLCGFVLLPGLAAAQAPPPAAAPAAAAPPAAVELPPLEELRAMRERPLFAPGRRPPTPPEPEEEEVAVEEAPVALQLTGIVRGEDFRVAVLKQEGVPEEARVRVNQSVGNWVLEEIGDRNVILKGNGKRVRLWLFDAAKKAATQAAPASAEAEEEADAEMVEPQEEQENVDEEVFPKADAPAAAAPARRAAPPPARPRKPMAGPQGSQPQSRAR